MLGQACRHRMPMPSMFLLDASWTRCCCYCPCCFAMTGPPHGLTCAAIEEALSQAKASKGVKKDDAVVQLLVQQHGQELRAQEQERKDITKYQVALVKQLIKRQQAKGKVSGLGRTVCALHE